MTVTAADVKALRDRTGVAMLACKKALEESQGDQEQALEILRKRGLSKAAEKSDRSTGEGVVAIAGKAMIKLLCETDFVAKNEQFLSLAQNLAQRVDQDGEAAAKEYFETSKSDHIQAVGENIVLGEICTLPAESGVIAGYVHSNHKLGALVALKDLQAEEKAREVAMHVVAMNPAVTRPDEVDQATIDKETAIYREQLQSAGKPENIIDQILRGKIQKFCADQALTCQPFVKDPSLTVEAYAGEVLGFVRFEI